MEMIIIDDDDETVYNDDELEGMRFTDLLRLASHNEQAKEFAMKKNLRGVAIKEDYSLYDYQIDAIKWMKMREETPHKDMRGGIICMEMGMGKTLIGITHALSSPKIIGPTLIIASKTVMIEWKTQGVEKFLDSVNVLYLHPDFTPKSEIAVLTTDKIRSYDIVLTTYDVCISACKQTAFYEECFEYGDEHSLMKNKIVSVNVRKNIKHSGKVGIETIYATHWDRVICDESQRFANHTTKLYHCMMAICANFRWCLSGTPIRNYDTDIWSQLRFCGYKTIDRATDWSRYGRLQFAAEDLQRVIYVSKYGDVGIALPEQTEVDEIVGMTPKQKEIYTKILNHANNVYRGMIEGNIDFANVIASFVRLRQCAIAPYLICSVSKRSDPQKSLTGAEWRDTDLGIRSPKILRVLDILEKIPKDDKVCFFTTFTSYSDLVARALDVLLPNVKYIQLDGDTPGAERNEKLEKFRADPSIRVILLTYKVGGEGLNLVEANHCIFGEPWWSNAVLKQAKARVWRTGQTKPVFVYNIISESTIEERILEICKEKDDMTSAYIQGKMKTQDSGLTKVMMGRILKMC